MQRQAEVSAHSEETGSAQAEALNRSTVVLVVGMHRSGTSAAAGILQRLGVALGSDLLAARPDSPKGYFEHRRLVEGNEAILARLRRTSTDLRPFPASWHASPGLGDQREQLKKFLRTEFSGQAVWGLKDPRICRLLPFWIPLLRELTPNLKILLVARNPYEVARSLEARDQLPMEHGQMLWLQHVLEAELKTRLLPRSVLLFEDLLRDWRGEMRRIAAELDLPVLADTTGASAEIESFLTRELRHHTAPTNLTREGPLSQETQRVYQALSAWVTGEATAEEFRARSREGTKLLEAAASMWAPLSERLEASEQEALERRDEIRRLHEELQRIGELAERVGAERDVARDALNDSMVDLTVLRDEAEGIRSDLDWARGQLSRSEEARQRAEDALAWAYQTRSWRITAPLRFATALGRKWSR